MARDHPKLVSIVVWNTFGLLLLGIGWIVALIISLTGGSQPQPQPAIIVHNHIGGSTAPTDSAGKVG